MMFCTLVQAVTVLQVERKQQLKCIMLYQFKAANIKCVWKYMQEPEDTQSGGKHSGGILDAEFTQVT